jgi:hypothetical protein
VANVVGAWTVPAPEVVTDAVPGVATLAAATTCPVVVSAKVAVNAADSARKLPVPTWLDAVAAMGAAALPVATALVVAKPDAGRLAVLCAAALPNAAADDAPLRDDALCQMAVFVGAIVPVAEMAAAPSSVAAFAEVIAPVVEIAAVLRSLAVFAMAAAAVPEIGAEATADPIPADTSVPVPVMLAD